LQEKMWNPFKPHAHFRSVLLTFVCLFSGFHEGCKVRTFGALKTKGNNPAKITASCLKEQTEKCVGIGCSLSKTFDSSQGIPFDNESIDYNSAENEVLP
jgi:hypothetical protein